MPGITFDPDAARRWLRSPSTEEPGMTIAQELSVDDDSTYGYDSGLLDFDSGLEDLVGTASSAGLFGAGWAVSLWLVRDGDGCCDGALVTVDVPSPPGAPLRLAGLHIDHKHLTDDRAASGEAAALAALATIASHARQVVADATEALAGGHPALTPAPYTGTDLTDAQRADLDEVVHEAATRRASAACNNGEQAALLVDLGWTPDMIRPAAGAGS